MQPRTKVRFALLAAVSTLGLGASSVPSSASPNPKIAICHRTASPSNPYVLISVAQDSVDDNLANDHGQGDHFLEHRGPIGPLGTGEWGDVIPPIPGVHDGLNWTTAGQAFLASGCDAATSLEVDAEYQHRRSVRSSCEIDGQEALGMSRRGHAQHAVESSCVCPAIFPRTRRTVAPLDER